MANVKKVASLGLTRTGTSISDVPDGPTVGSATNVGTSRAFNNGSATVAYTAASTGGTATTFTATSTPGSFTGTGTSPITVTGLQSATSYIFTVSAANANGTFTSASSSSITATTVPQAPTIGTASSPTSTTASVPFSANATGGSAITGFTATSSPGGLTGTGSSSPITVSGLTAGTAYTFTVTATNANGNSAASAASNSVTPNIPYFLATLDGGGNDSAVGIKFDSSGNIYTSGIFSSAGDIGVVKYNSLGVVQWQRRLASAGYDTGRDIALDSSGNIYVCGSNAGLMILAKYDNSGAIQWQRTLGTNGGGANNIALDSSGNPHIIGYSNFVSQGNYFFVLAKYDTSGNLQWQRRGGTEFQEGKGIAVDSSGNVFIAAESNSKMFLAKYNSSGTIQWQFKSAQNVYGENMTIDSLGNIYVLGKQFSPGVGFVLKLDTNGSVLWQRSVTPPQNNTVLEGIAVDSSFNVYVSGEGDFNTGTARDMYLAKFNSSGTVQWQRRLSGHDSDYSHAVAVDGSGNIAFAADTWLGSYGALVGVVPTDGSKTGTYTVGSQSFNYYVGNATIATSSLAFSTSSLTTATPTLTSSTSTLTDSASTLTANVTTI